MPCIGISAIQRDLPT